MTEGRADGSLGEMVEGGPLAEKGSSRVRAEGDSGLDRSGLEEGQKRFVCLGREMDCETQENGAG